MIHVEDLTVEDLQLIEDQFLIIDKSWWFDTIVDLELDELFTSMIEEAEASDVYA